jgi:hypothetical protein
MPRTRSSTGVNHPVFAIGRYVDQPSSVRGKAHTITMAAATTGRFLLHFLEMVIAMGVGMAIFGPFKSALVDQGYTALLDRTSIDYQFWMNLFMVVPMVLWMRARGHMWRHGIEMGGAMIIPTACVILLCRAGVTDVLPWFTTSLTGIAMFGGMLVYMLYRREMYCGGYSFGWHRGRAARAHVSGTV